jgi:DNA-binding NarL/FixJ family response regulator
MVTIDSSRRSRTPRLPRSGAAGEAASVPYPARIIVVDDHDIPRAGLRGLLGGLPELEVVTEATSGHQAVALCRRLIPDLVLMELELPGLDGVSATRIIRRECPDTRVVIVTQRDDPASLRHAIEAGAAAFLMKTATAQEILTALRRVLSGELVLDHDLTTRALHQMVEAPSWSGAGLTAREHEVLRLVAHGKTNQEIGLTLAVSTRTAKAHVERIIGRLGVANRAEAVARAIGLGMLTPPGPR